LPKKNKTRTREIKKKKNYDLAKEKRYPVKRKTDTIIFSEKNETRTKERKKINHNLGKEK